jgi:hypothetical protein
MAPPRWGASSIDHHDCIFPDKRCRIAPARVFVELCTLGGGPQGHEAPHHATVLELVLDGVCVVWTGLLEEPLEVVRRRPHLMLSTVCGG